MSEGALDFDLVIVGGGPAGIAAGVAAAERGKRVALIESSASLGGAIWRGNEASATSEANVWREKLRASSTRIFPNTTVIDAPEPGVWVAEKGADSLVFHAARTVLAVGARELFLPFPGWTLPNVYGVGGLQVLAKAGWPVAGKRVVVAGSGPLLIAAAAKLREKGARIVFIAEQAPWGRLCAFGAKLPFLAPDKIAQAIGYQWQLKGAPYRAGWWPVEAHGRDAVGGVTLQNGTRQRTFACDYLACGFELVPNVELPRLIGCRLRAGSVEVDNWQETSVYGVYCAGEPTGIGGVDRALVEGQIAALTAVGAKVEAQRLWAAREKTWRFTQAMDAAFALRPEVKSMAKPETLVCRCEDVPQRALEPFGDWRAAKLHTRCGMGPCQGRICGSATDLIFGWKHDSTRPPVFPVKLGTIGKVESDK